MAYPLLKFIYLPFLGVIAIATSSLASTSPRVSMSFCPERSSSLNSDRVAGENSAATLIRHHGRSLVLAKSFSFQNEDLDKICFHLHQTNDVPLQLKLLARDASYGLSLFEAPLSLDGLKLQSPRDAVSFEEKYLPNQTNPVTETLLNSRRHFLRSNLQLVEVTIPGPLEDSSFFKNGGLGLELRRGEPRLGGLLSEQSVLIRPGAPAFTLREQDLIFLKNLPPVSYRLALKPIDVQRWIEQVLRSAPETQIPRLVQTQATSLMEGRAYSKYIVHGQIHLEESCADPFDVSLNQLAPVGGKVDPVGIGGADQILSRCRLKVSPLSGSSPLGLRLLGSESHPSHSLHLLVAYQKQSLQWRIRSLLNAHDFANLIQDSKWIFARDLSYDENAASALQKQAHQTRLAIENFFRMHKQNPGVLRKAYLLATLLRNDEKEVVDVSDLNRMKNELIAELPLTLHNHAERTDAEKSSFALSRSQLIEAFTKLALEREKSE